MFFDASEEKQTDLKRGTLLEPGIYTLRIEDIEVKNTKKGDGKFVAITFEIADSNRKFWANFNIENSSSSAQEIGRTQFADLCFAATNSIPKFKSEVEMYRALSNKSLKTKIYHFKNKKTDETEARAVSYWTLDNKHRSGVNLNEKLEDKKQQVEEDVPF